MIYIHNKNNKLINKIYYQSHSLLRKNENYKNR